MERKLGERASDSLWRNQGDVIMLGLFAAVVALQVCNFGQFPILDGESYGIASASGAFCLLLIAVSACVLFAFWCFLESQGSAAESGPAFFGSCVSCQGDFVAQAATILQAVFGCSVFVEFCDWLGSFAVAASLGLYNGLSHDVALSNRVAIGQGHAGSQLSHGLILL